jgi:hypothetical protein
MPNGEMAVLPPRIPKLIKLPGGFNVKVTQLKPSKMKEKHGEYYDAIWDLDTMSVDLNKGLNHQRKWYVFSHEYNHVVNDWMHWLINEEIAKG